MHELCRDCDHFIEDNGSSPEDVKRYGLADYVHLDDGEKEHDHDAIPSGISMPIGWWQLLRPDLFEADSAGVIGPNRPDHLKLERPA
jgi:hypothetical protein